MAVPTISALSPAAGPATGGTLVEISGTNFKVPQFCIEVPESVLAPTVAVSFDGQPADHVDVCSSTLLRVVTPRYLGNYAPDKYPPIDVVVSNLNANGTVVAGETATREAGYLYGRWLIHGTAEAQTAEVALLVIREFLTYLRRDVLNTAGFARQPDYVEDGAMAVVIETIPYIGLTVSLSEDKDYGYQDNGFEEISNGSQKIDAYRHVHTEMAALSITIAAEGMTEALNIGGAIESMILTRPEVTLDAGRLYPGQINKYPLEMTQHFQQADGGQSDAGVVVGNMAVRIRNICALFDTPSERQTRIAHGTVYQADMEGNLIDTDDVF